MLRALLSALILLPLTVVVVLFAVSNRAAITAGLYPLPFTVTAPLYLFVVASFVVGAMLGALMVWAAGHRARATARREGKRAARLEQELIALRAVALRVDAPSATQKGTPPLSLT